VNYSLIFDTETTGKLDFKLPPDHITQPRVVQLAAMLLDEKWMEVQAMNFIIKPGAFTIPDEAAEIHGIDTDTASRIGVNLYHALGAFVKLASVASEKVAFNIEFDVALITGELSRTGYSNFAGLLQKGQFCVMKAMTPICKLPGQHNDYKWPKLQEAHKHAFGAEFDGAHDAMADVRATAALYRWLKEGGAKA
jgi:DNA polymerase III epsilon subunit-like protein